MKKTFLKFVETNDWEGEQWNFYLQIEGNEKALKELAALISGRGEYALENTPISEAEVDILVKHSRGGYLNFENKVTGRLSISKIILNSESETDTLYKGGIRDAFLKKAKEEKP